MQYHALRTRQSGARRFVSFHVLVPGMWTVHRGHELLEDIEARIREAVPNVTVFTHLESLDDPSSWDDQHLDRPGGDAPAAATCRPREGGAVKPAAALVIGLALAGVMWAQDRQVPERVEGGIVRGPRHEKLIALEFTGHEFAEGASHHPRRTGAAPRPRVVLPDRRLPPARGVRAVVRRLVAEGHYLGPHSDKHLLYCAWESRAKTLVTRDELRRDLDDNIREIARFGVARRQVRYWVPAYEWYNADIVAWSAELGLTLVNFTSGTRSNADYTGEQDRGFRVVPDDSRQHSRRGSSADRTA